MRVQRLAVVGDVHAEDARLALALGTAATLNVDLIACTGDVVDGTGSVERCCRLLREHSVACVRGNHDRWLFTGMLRDGNGATQLESLNTEDRQFLQNLPAIREVLTYSGLMLLCHGVGSSDLAKITSYDSEYSVRTNRHLREVTQAGRYRLMVNGHSHDRLVLNVDDLLIVNAGALCHPNDPGFLLLDFPNNLLQWHSLRGARVTVAEEGTIFDVAPEGRAGHGG